VNKYAYKYVYIVICQNAMKIALNQSITYFVKIEAFKLCYGAWNSTSHVLGYLTAGNLAFKGEHGPVLYILLLQTKIC